jgi:hypothetical protein
LSERLLLDFDAFFLEHRLCGDLDGGTSDESGWRYCPVRYSGMVAGLNEASV